MSTDPTTPTTQPCLSPEERARRAYALIDAFGWRIAWPHDKPVPDDGWPIDIIRHQIEEALKDAA